MLQSFDSRPVSPKAIRPGVGVLLLSASNAFRLAVQFLLFPVLAHLLSPSDYGLIGMAMPLVLFALTLGDGGMGPALLRASDPEGEIETTMFWAALGTGIVCAAMLGLAAPLAGTLLKNKHITPVLLCLAPVMVLSALSSVPAVRVQKSGATWIFAVGDVISTLGGAAVAFAAALSGWGVWSLVFQQLVIWLAKFVVMLRLAGIRVRGRPKRSALAYLLSHGTALVGSNLLNLFSISIDALLVGRMLGAAQLGYYVLAFQVVRIPEALLNGPVFVSFLPALTQLNLDRAAGAALFLRTARMMLFISAPVMLGLALTADLSVPLLLGARWHHSVPVLMILAPTAVLQTIGWLSRAVLVGYGRSGLQFRISVLNAAAILAGVLAGLHAGIVGIALGVSLAVAAGNSLYIIAAARELRLSPQALARPIMPILGAAALMCLAVGVSRLAAFNQLQPLPALALAAGIGVLTYGGALMLFAPDMVNPDTLQLWRRARMTS